MSGALLHFRLCARTVLAPRRAARDSPAAGSIAVMNLLSSNSIGAHSSRGRPRHIGLFASEVLAFASLMLVPLASALPAPAQIKPKEPQFKYVGGTENVLAGCQGTLELTAEALNFQCAQYSIRVPYGSITVMQYRADVSRKVRKLKLTWKVRPPGGGGRTNRYFSLLYADREGTHAMVLQVAPDDMRPYLAEIDLKTGRRVDVQSHEQLE